MYAGAAASLIGVVIDFTGIGSLKTTLHNRSPKLTPAQLTTAEHFVVVEFIVAGLIGAALWIFVARACQAGKGWARILGTVLFAIDTLFQFILTAGGGARIYSLLVWLIGLGAIVLLWQRTSTAYFRSSQPG